MATENPPAGKKRKPPSKQIKSVKAIYDDLLLYFRTTPGDVAGAARAAGCHISTARRAWTQGWPRYDWSRPIKAVIEEDDAAVRADRVRRAALTEDERTRVLADAADEGKRIIARAEQSAAARLTAVESEAKRKYDEFVQRAKLDVAETRADEALLARSVRKTAISVAGLVGVLYQDIKAVADKVRKALADEKMDAKTALHIARQLAALGGDMAALTRQAYEIERVRVGDPAFVVGIDVKQEDVAIDDVDRKAAAVMAAVARVRARGVNILPGSGDSPGGAA